MAKTVIIKIKRQENPGAHARWEEFALTWKPGMNVISAMMEIAANPVTRHGQPTTPIVYDSNCLEEVCGSCAMLINGRARMACSAWASAHARSEARERARTSSRDRSPACACTGPMATTWANTSTPTAARRRRQTAPTAVRDAVSRALARSSTSRKS